jgi:hypothetical protein
LKLRIGKVDLFIKWAKVDAAGSAKPVTALPPEPAPRGRTDCMGNVWSAAVLQAKDEDDRIGLRECIRPLSE